MNPFEQKVQNEGTSEKKENIVDLNEYRRQRAAREVLYPDEEKREKERLELLTKKRMRLRHLAAQKREEEPLFEDAKDMQESFGALKPKEPLTWKDWLKSFWE